MIVMEGEEFLTAQEACAALGIKAATLYAYVSRGVLHSYRQGIKRTRLYARAEVDRLLRLRGPEERDAGAGQGVAGDGAWIRYL
jgi:excisionase family DNA binding protein